MGMSLSDLFGKRKEKVSLILDIGSGTVGGAYVSYADGQIPRVVRQLLLSYTTDETTLVTGVVDIKNMLLSLDAVLMRLTVEKIKADNIQVVFSHPWCVEETRHVNISQDKKFIVTQNFLDDITTQEMKKFLADVGTGDTTLDGTLKPIEARRLTMFVNGYPVFHPDNLRTQLLDLSIFFSAVSQVVCDEVSKVVFAHTHMSRQHISFHTMPFVSYSVMHVLSPMDYLYMDILGETTSIFLVKNGLPAKTVSFLSGTHFVVRKVAEVFKVSPEIAVSLIDVVFAGKADEELSEKMKTLMEDVEKEWAIYFEDALLSLDPHLALPTKVFFSSSERFIPLYEEFLSVSTTDATAIFRKNIHHVPVTHEFFSSHISYTSHENYIPHLVLCAIFCAKA